MNMLSHSLYIFNRAHRARLNISHTMTLDCAHIFLILTELYFGRFHRKEQKVMEFQSHGMNPLSTMDLRKVLPQRSYTKGFAPQILFENWQVSSASGGVLSSVILPKPLKKTASCYLRIPGLAGTAIRIGAHLNILARTSGFRVSITVLNPCLSIWYFAARYTHALSFPSSHCSFDYSSTRSDF